MHWEPVGSLSTEGGQADIKKPIFLSTNFTNANTNTCTQPSYTTPYQANAWEHSWILVRQQTSYLVK